METPVLHRIVLDGADPAAELGVTAALLTEAADPGAPPTLLITRLTGDARALGRFQPAPPSPEGYVRRRTGGHTSAYGAGTVSVCLVVPDRMAFAGVPFLDKLLNRAVRGTVRGLTALGLSAAYGGRDFVSAAGRRVGLVAMAAGPGGGAALFQAVLGLTAPARAGEDGEASPWTPLAGLVPDLAFEPLAEALARGHHKATGRAVVDRPAPAPAAAAAAEPDPDLAWGDPVAVPIGTLAAGVRLDGRGRVEALGLRGDFMADEGFISALGEALHGRVPERGAVTRAVEELLADPARHAMPGVPDPTAIVSAVVAAAQGERSHVVRV